jgi:hypothetical protein
VKREKLQQTGHNRGETVDFQQLKTKSVSRDTSEPAIAVHWVAEVKNVQYLQGNESGFFKLLLSAKCRNSLLSD